MRIKARVTPDARRELFVIVKNGEFAISVKEPAEGNAANDRVRTLIAEHLGVRMQAIRFISGMRGKTKIFEVIE